MSEEEKIIGILKKYTEAFSEEIPEKIMGLWTDDGVLMPPCCKSFVGREAIKKNYHFQFGYLKDICHCILHFNPEKIRINENSSYVVGTLKDILHPVNGSQVKEKIVHQGKFVMLLTRNNKAGWRIKYFIWNLDEIESYFKKFELLSDSVN